MDRSLHILLTGASGFVGQALSRIALKKGHRIMALVRDPALAPAGVTPLVHVLGSGAPLILPEDLDAVAHLAQSRAYRAFPGDADEMFHVNVCGTHELLQAASTAKISRFCLVSSGAVYDPFLGALTEEAALAPAGNLGATKLAAEILARPYASLFPMAILRLFAPYGPGQTARLIPDLIRRVREGEAVTLPLTGGGMCFAPSYVDDVCDALIASIEQSWSGVFNVAGREALSIEQAVTIIGQALSKRPVLERKQMDAPNIAPDLTRFATHYDLNRFRNFSDGIAATLLNRI